MLKVSNITIIGTGTMGPAMARGMLTNAVTKPANITMVSPSQERLDELTGELGVQTNTSSMDAAAEAEIVILAVKPHLMKAVCQEIRPVLDAKDLVLSVAAGVRIDTIRKCIGIKKMPIVRVMPNTPAQVGMGMSGWTATPEVSVGQKRNVKQILQALGEEMYFEEEDALDLVTAISGSGPAYFYYFIESLTKAGTSLGLPEKVASSLAQQTAYGAIELLKKRSATPAALRKEVTSPGGTTEAALKSLNTEHFDDIVQHALESALKRAKELSKE